VPSAVRSKHLVLVVDVDALGLVDLLEGIDAIRAHLEDVFGREMSHELAGPVGVPTPGWRRSARRSTS
jgi:hypothetical protein